MNPTRPYPKIKGLIAATFTPFSDSGRINPSVISQYAQRLKAQGVAGVFVNGSSGEGLLLSSHERMLLTEAWAAHSDDNFKIIVHIGGASVEMVKELAVHCQATKGIYAVASMAPNFFASSEVPVIADYCRQVAAAAPQLPFYYYHLPVMTGARIKVHQLLQHVAASIPNFAGVKFTYTDFMDMHQCLALDDQRFDILHGHDEILLSGLVLGIQAAIGTTFNFIPNVYHQVMQAHARNDLEAARAWQLRSIQVVEVMLKYVNAIVGGKAIMQYTGIDCGPCRTPLRNLTVRELDQLHKELDAIQFDAIKG